MEYRREEQTREGKAEGSVNLVWMGWGWRRTEWENEWEMRWGKGWDGKERMVKSRWVGWKGQSNLISSALSQSMQMPGRLSHVTQRIHTVGRLKDFAEMSLPHVTSQANKQYNGTHTHPHTQLCAHVQVPSTPHACYWEGFDVCVWLSCLSNPIQLLGTYE